MADRHLPHLPARGLVAADANFDPAKWHRVRSRRFSFGGLVDEAIGAAEREEDIGRARVEAEGLADAFEGIGLGGETGEEVEAVDGGGDEVGGVEPVAVAVEGETVGGGEGEVGHVGWRVGRD